ncbi:MAG: ABC transporter ATP-binding protein [Alphaproteobacteria bacterium]|nr:ABC transporter ATP-binding protein [Alphaproteobacteria bacterium]
MAGDLVRIEQVTKRYGEVTALAGISLRVEQGEFMALLGPSGCGKTTLLRAIAGFIDPSAGTIWIDGKDITRLPPNRRPTNTVFQNYALFPHYNVRDNVAYGPRRRGVRSSLVADMVAEALAMVGMESLAERYPAQLSGGQQQRVALARAIVNRPKVLLLDEPLGALDLKLRKRMQIELKRLHEKLGISFLYVTHDQEEALVMADRIAVMRAGEIVQLGSGEDIYRRPNSRYVADFIGEANLLPCVVDGAGGLCLEAGGRPLPYRTATPEGASATLLIRPEDIEVIDGSAPEGDVALPAVVRDVVFVGNSVRIYARSEPGIELMIAAPGSRAAGLHPGLSIMAGWRQGAGRVLLT